MISNNDCFTMPVVPAGYGTNCNNGNGAFGNGDWLWIIVVFALLFGWGNNGWGNGVGANNGGGNSFVPYMVGSTYTDSAVQRGFDNQAVINKLNGLEQGVCNLGYEQLSQMGSLGRDIMQGFHGVDNAVCTLGFNTQSGLSALQAQLADCCCTTQRAIDNVNYNMASNTCAITNQMANNTRDIIDSNNAGTRAILDYLCQKENADLRSELQTLKMERSNAEQNAYITANQQAQTAELIRRLGADCPQPAYVVQPPQPVTFPTNCCGNVTYAQQGCNQQTCC